MSQENYEGDFGTADVLSAKGDGADRFYVMALSDIDSDYHHWYYNAKSEIDNDYNVLPSENDFGEGKANTARIIEAWNSEIYGSQETEGKYRDIWGLDLVQEKCNNGWFIPSKSEWAAFGDAFEITSSNYANYKLNYQYWSSTMYWPNEYNTTFHSYTAAFGTGSMLNTSVYECAYIRLSTTF